MSKLTKLRNASYAPLGEWAYHEITTLRAQLAEATSEIARLIELDKRTNETVGMWIEKNQLLQTENTILSQQLLATQAHAARLGEALEFMQHNAHTRLRTDLCIAAKEALSTPINLDALHEDRAEFIDDVANRLLTEVCFKMGSGSPYRKMLHDYIDTLREEAAAHRAKKESK